MRVVDGHAMVQAVTNTVQGFRGFVRNGVVSEVYCSMHCIVFDENRRHGYNRGRTTAPCSHQQHSKAFRHVEDVGSYYEPERKEL